MNERIRQLYYECQDESQSTEQCYQQFAELIVAECINKVRSRQMFSIEDEHNIHHAFDLLVYDLESYFGVEE
jgi:hypothetical protein